MVFLMHSYPKTNMTFHEGEKKYSEKRLCQGKGCVKLRGYLLHYVVIVIGEDDHHSQHIQIQITEVLAFWSTPELVDVIFWIGWVL